MQKQMVSCEDGKDREARVYGMPRVDGDFEILQAGVRIKGRHVTGEAWYSYKTSSWYFLTGTDGKNKKLLPRYKEKPNETPFSLLQSPRVRGG
jgi:hypothetical protein